MAYDHVKVITKDKFIKAENLMAFPAQPFKLVAENGNTVADLGQKEILDRAIGFVIKAVPGGIAVADIYTK